MLIIDTTKINKEITDKYKIVNNSFRIVAKDNPKDYLKVLVSQRCLV